MQLTADESDELKLASVIVRRESYVEDFITGAFSLEEGLAKQRELVSLLKSGGFELGKWAANVSELIN